MVILNYYLVLLPCRKAKQRLALMPEYNNITCRATKVFYIKGIVNGGTIDRGSYLRLLAVVSLEPKLGQ